MHTDLSLKMFFVYSDLLVVKSEFHRFLQISFRYSNESMIVIFFRSCSSNSADQQGQLEICYLNLSSFASIRKCAQHLSTTEPKIHILINNAGVFFHPFEITEDGFETHLQVNHLGHFLLTLLLLPRIQQSTPGCRIINLASKVYMCK